MFSSNDLISAPTSPNKQSLLRANSQLNSNSDWQKQGSFWLSLSFFLKNGILIVASLAQKDPLTHYFEHREK